MSYFVPCVCGRTIEVTATQAGADVPCSCGRAVRTPLLSQLRQLAGHKAYETSSIDTINRMIRDGELPFGDTCAISGLLTSDSCNLYVQCESMWIKGPGFFHHLFVAFTMLAFPFWIIWVLLGWALLDERREEVGRDRSVCTPLRICQEHHRRLRRTRSQSKLRKLLRTVPIYAQLLDEYPQAKIVTYPLSQD